MIVDTIHTYNGVEIHTYDPTYITQESTPHKLLPNSPYGIPGIFAQGLNPFGNGPLPSYSGVLPPPSNPPNIELPLKICPAVGCEGTSEFLLLDLLGA